MSSDFEALHLVETDDFSAWVQTLDSMPASKVMPLITAQDGGTQFALAIELLKETMAPDLIDAFDNLTMKQTIVFLTKWMSTSREQS